MGFLMRTSICLFTFVLTACGGGGASTSTATAISTSVTSTFSSQYIDLPITDNLVKNVCTTESPTGGLSMKVAVADLNSDGINDLVSVYWCSYSKPGQAYDGPTPSTLITYLSQPNGQFILGNKQLFGTDLVNIGGQSNGFTIGDFNKDGKPDIGIGVSKEDGRANLSTWTAPQVVLLSRNDGTYSVERFAIQASSGTVQAVDNEVGGIDFVYTTFAQAVATAYRYINGAWQQIAGYPQVNVGLKFFNRIINSQGSTKVVTLSTDPNDGPSSLQIQEKVNGQWNITSKYVYPNTLVNVINWNGESVQTNMATINNTSLLYTTFEDNCIFKSSKTSEMIILARVGGFVVDPNSKTILDERYLPSIAMLVPFNITGGLTPITDLFDTTVIDKTFTNYKCIDINNDGYMDVVINVQGTNISKTIGEPIFFINNKSGKLIKTSVQDLPKSPQGANGWADSSSLFEDMNGDGIPDLVYFNTLGPVPFTSGSRSSFRIYLANKFIGT